MAEYRLDELSRISGVSTRNIRAYRERGLLDPPRRVGRSAYYDDYQLSQLRTINQLLRRGFNSAHIAEFFASMREGADLADILGIQRALLGSPVNDSETESAGGKSPAEDKPAPRPRALDIDPHGDTASMLIDYGLAERRQGLVVVVDATIAEILGRATDQLQYVHALLRFYESSRDAADALASGFVRSLEEVMDARFGNGREPEPGEVDELGQLTQNYRELWGHVLSDRLEESMQRQLLAGASGPSTRALLSELLRL
ncbi:MerR family transcriptional regulator [Mycolicibacterium tusciae]|uniref:MerR family transcriptional regulator n=1 Tax=Mycolicibacterium tusciae TaxID=75922 RepID=UPI00024A21D3|nr:MerR family transcriptional regulator [Mycolicibacterium tusciae]